MNLNRISVGGGLAMLGCSIFALAGAMVVSSGGNPAQAGSPMFAGDRKGEAVPLMPSMLDGEPTRGVEGGAEVAAMGAACGSTGEPQQWFGAIRRITQCFEGEDDHRPGRIPLGHADVNGDGVPEAF